MSTISISDLQSTVANSLANSESSMTDLTNDELAGIKGGDDILGIPFCGTIPKPRSIVYKLPLPAISLSVVPGPM